MKAAGEDLARRTLSFLVERYSLRRGNWEVDCPEMVERVVAMARGREPIAGRFAAVAADHSYAFIEVLPEEGDALDQLSRWASDEQFPKCPLALADLREGSVHPVRVTVSRGAAPQTPTEEARRW